MSAVLYTNAHQRLKELAVTGPFFSVAEMGTFFKLPQTDVHQMLHRWTKNGLAEPIGPRAGVSTPFIRITRERLSPPSSRFTRQRL